MFSLIFFMIITFFLIHKLDEMLGLRVGFSDNKQNRNDFFAEEESEIEETTVQPLQKKLDEIAAFYPRFERDDFLKKSRAAFEIIFKAYARGDKRSMKDLVSARVMEAFSRAIDDRNSREEKLEGNIERFISSEIIDASTSDESLFITVKFVTEQSNILRDRDNQIIEGAEDFVENRTDIWTFFRKKSASDNKWFLYELKQN